MQSVFLVSVKYEFDLVKTGVESGGFFEEREKEREREKKEKIHP